MRFVRFFLFLGDKNGVFDKVNEKICVFQKIFVTLCGFKN